MPPGAGLLQQGLGIGARLGIERFGPDRKLIERAERAVELGLQVLVTAAVLFHEQQPDPVPAQVHPLGRVMGEQPVQGEYRRARVTAVVSPGAGEGVQVRDPGPQLPVVR
jgi:hypothetical protein